MRPRAIRRLLTVTAAPALVIGLAGVGLAADRNAVAPQPLPVPELASRATLIFKGAVTRVEYKDAESVPLRDAAGAPIVERTGQPVLVDGSGVPHTFVTFRVEQIYKGKVAGPELTLRFLGGQSTRRAPDSRTPMVLEVGHSPLFDVGDRDVLFVEGNTDKICPLTACDQGRFRLVGSRAPQVFSDRGNSIVQFTDPSRSQGSPGVAGLGPQRQIREYLENRIGEVVYREEVSGRSADPGRAPEPEEVLGRHFTENAFDHFLTALIRRTHDTRELAALPATSSADITRPIMPDPLTDAAPTSNREEQLGGPETFEDHPADDRAALIEADRQERAAVAANGGNPVLPRKGN